MTRYDIKISRFDILNWTGDERELNEEIMLDDDIKMEAVSDSEGEEDNAYDEEEDGIDEDVLGEEKDNIDVEGSNIF